MSALAREIFQNIDNAWLRQTPSRIPLGDIHSVIGPMKEANSLSGPIVSLIPAGEVPRTFHLFGQSNRVNFNTTIGTILPREDLSDRYQRGPNVLLKTLKYDDNADMPVYLHREGDNGYYGFVKLDLEDIDKSETIVFSDVAEMKLRRNRDLLAVYDIETNRLLAFVGFELGPRYRDLILGRPNSIGEQNAISLVFFPDLFIDQKVRAQDVVKVL